MTEPILINPKLSESQLACVDLLKETLAEAERGMINTIGIVVCMKSGYATVMAGTQAGGLNLGCDSLKKKILDAVEDNGVNKRQSGSIVRAR